MTTLYSSLLHTHYCSHIFTVVAWYRVPTADFPLHLCSHTAPGLSYWFLTATAHKTVSPLAHCNSLFVLLITFLHEPYRKHLSSIVVQVVSLCLLGCLCDRYSAIAQQRLLYSFYFVAFAWQLVYVTKYINCVLSITCAHSV
jgi:hypothetical protein